MIDALRMHGISKLQLFVGHLIEDATRRVCHHRLVLPLMDILWNVATPESVASLG